MNQEFHLSNEKSRLFGRLANIINGLSMLVSFKFVSSEERLKDMRNCIIYENPFLLSLNMFRKSFGISARYLSEICVHIISIYVVLSYIPAILIHYWRDEELVNWQPTIENYERWRCNLSDINSIFKYENDLKRYLRVIDLTRRLAKTHDYTLLSCSGTSSVLLAAHVFIAIGYFFIGVWIGMKRLKVDSIGFLLNPRLERSECKKEINSIFDDIIHSLDNTVTYSSLRFDSLDRRHEKMYKEALDEGYRKKSRLPNHGNILFKYNPEAFNCDELVKIKYKSIYKCMLVELKKMDLVEPANLMKKYHEKICKNYIFNFYNFILSGVVTTVVFVSIFIYLECDIRFNQRFKYYNCKENTKFTDYMYVQLLPELNELDISKYLNSAKDNTIQIDYWELVLIELKYYLWDLHAINNLIIVIVSTSNTYHLLIFYAGLNIITHSEKIVWLNQIIEQVKTCISMLNDLNESSDDEMRDAAHENQRNINIYRSMTVAYVQFELFRRRHSAFQELATYLILQILFICGSLIYVINTVITTIHVDSKLVLYFVLNYLVVLLNFYLIMSAILTNKIEKLRILIIRMLAATKTNGFNFCHITDLWAREILSPEEMNQLFAPSFAGVYLNFTNVVTINGYLAAIYCLLSFNRKN